jgi:hypothetical protein
MAARYWGHCTLYGVHCTKWVQFSTIQKQSESKKHIMIITYRYFSIYNEEVYAFSYCKDWRKEQAKDQRGTIKY